MAQGKLKVKGKLPDKTKTKKKGAAVTKRANKPIAPKKQKFQEANKLKKMVTKAVNKSVEEEMRSRSAGAKKTLSKAQEAVVTHHTRTRSGSSKTST